MVGYRCDTSTETSPPQEAVSAPEPPAPASPKQPAVVTSVSHLKSIGSKSLAMKKKKDVTGTASSDILSTSAVLENITMDIEQGGKVAIVGKNGAGKRCGANYTPLVVFVSMICVCDVTLPIPPYASQYSAATDHCLRRGESGIKRTLPCRDGRRGV